MMESTLLRQIGIYYLSRRPASQRYTLMRLLRRAGEVEAKYAASLFPPEMRTMAVGWRAPESRYSFRHNPKAKAGAVLDCRA